MFHPGKIFFATRENKQLDIDSSNRNLPFLNNSSKPFRTRRKGQLIDSKVNYLCLPGFRIKVLFTRSVFIKKLQFVHIKPQSMMKTYLLVTKSIYFLCNKVKILTRLIKSRGVLRSTRLTKITNFKVSESLVIRQCDHKVVIHSSSLVSIRYSSIFSYDCFIHNIISNYKIFQVLIQNCMILGSLSELKQAIPHLKAQEIKRKVESKFILHKYQMLPIYLIIRHQCSSK